MVSDDRFFSPLEKEILIKSQVELEVRTHLKVTGRINRCGLKRCLCSDRRECWEHRKLHHEPCYNTKLMILESFVD